MINSKNMIDADELLRTINFMRSEGLIKSISDVIRIIERMKSRNELQ